MVPLHQLPISFSSHIRKDTGFVNLLLWNKMSRFLDNDHLCISVSRSFHFSSYVIMSADFTFPTKYILHRTFHLFQESIDFLMSWSRQGDPLIMRIRFRG